MSKIFIIGDKVKINNKTLNNQKWICDRLKDEFLNTNPQSITNNPLEADYIWFLSPWNYVFIPNNFKKSEWVSLLKTKKIILTIHHIDLDYFKKGKYNSIFNFLKEYDGVIHSICIQTTEELKKITNITIITKHLWLKDSDFYSINNKDSLKKKYNLNSSAYLIGSFQNEKKSKCPEIFLNIIKDIYSKNKNLEVILAGRNRNFIINNLKKLKIKYYYFEMVSINVINELYNCLDLYIITSKYEGGPRSILECALTNTPIISTKVGIANEFMDPKSLYNANNWISYKDAIPNTQYIKQKIKFLTDENYIKEFKQTLFP